MIAEFALSGLFILAVACALSALGLFSSRKRGNIFYGRISLCAGVCGSLLISAAALLAILDNNDLIFGLYPLCPGFNIYFGLDRLSGIFLLLLGMVSCAASVYISGDLGHDIQKKYKMRLFSRNALMYAFIISMSLVLMARDIIGFISFWELMAVSSFLLVMYNYEDKKTQKAGMYYFAMTQLSTVFVIAGFLVL
ncbi:MAG: hypothetical protein JXQ82_00250, partial [Methanomicrobiaceae archaeon]|nr:hypothetical protein [Methanomicrobiaceae archaeon]